LYKIEDIRENILLSDYTTYKVGGPAEYLAVAKNSSQLQDLLNFAQEKNLEFVILGRGSNVIICDKGLKGLVIINESIGMELKEREVTVASGMELREFIQKLHEKEKGGLEFLANIPGTVGGAVAVNAGCYGSLVSDRLKRATVFYDGKVESVTVDFFEYSYRSSKLKKGFKAVVLDATFKIDDIEKEESMKIIREDRNLREKKHPKEPSCGSFFKNPSRENTAGSLIEKAGLMGHAIGGAKVSEEHANFIINTGNATASDLRNLSLFIKEKVKEKTDFELEEEVQFLGEF